MKTMFRLSLACSVLLAAHGCGDDAKDEGPVEDASTNAPNDSGTQDDAGTDAAPPPAPIFVQAGVQTPMSYTTYLTVVDPPLGSVDIRGGIEAAAGLSHTFGTSVFVPIGAEIHRYEQDDQGKLTAKEVLSFAGLGLSWVSGAQMRILSADKAYVIDSAGLRVILWNPATMKLADKTIDLSSELTRTGCERPRFRRVSLPSDLALA